MLLCESPWRASLSVRWWPRPRGHVVGVGRPLTPHRSVSAAGRARGKPPMHLPSPPSCCPCLWSHPPVSCWPFMGACLRRLVTRHSCPTPGRFATRRRFARRQAARVFCGRCRVWAPPFRGCFRGGTCRRAAAPLWAASRMDCGAWLQAGEGGGASPVACLPADALALWGGVFSRNGVRGQTGGALRALSCDVPIPWGCSRPISACVSVLPRRPNSPFDAPNCRRQCAPPYCLGLSVRAFSPPPFFGLPRAPSLFRLAPSLPHSTRLFLFFPPLQAVLESVAELSTAPTTFPIPTKGTYISFKSGGGTHEAHVSVQSVASVALSTEPAKVGGHDLHVMRLLGVGGGPILSLLVAWAEGEGPGSYVRRPLFDGTSHAGGWWVLFRVCGCCVWQLVSHPGL